MPSITYRATDLRSSNNVLKGTALDQLSRKYTQALLLWSRALWDAKKRAANSNLYRMLHIFFIKVTEHAEGKDWDCKAGIQRAAERLKWRVAAVPRAIR